MLSLIDLLNYILEFLSHRCAKDIDTLIESLPNEDSSQELQAQSLRRLEMENQEAAKRLEEVRLIQNIRFGFILEWNFQSNNEFLNFQIVDRGQKTLEKIQAALSDIAQAQLDMEYLISSSIPSP